MDEFERNAPGEAVTPPSANGGLETTAPDATAALSAAQPAIPITPELRVEIARTLGPGFVFVRQGGGPCWVANQTDPWGEFAHRNTPDTRWDPCYHVGVVPPGLGKKAEKADLKALRFLHADVDPRAAESPATYSAEREAIIAAYNAAVAAGTIPPASIVVRSNGFHFLWALAEQLPATEENIRRVEGINRAIGRIFGDRADDVNVDRILRVPGTTNHPDAAKTKRGRVPVSVELLRWEPKRPHRLDGFPSPVFADAAPAAAVDIDTASVRRLDESALEKLPVAEWCKLLVIHGRDLINETRYKSRSDALFAVVCEMVRKGVSNEDSFSIITDARWGISESVLEQGHRVEQYALRQIERARGKVFGTGVLLEAGGSADAIASAFLERVESRLVTFAGDVYEYGEGRYIRLDEATIGARVYEFARGCYHMDPKGGVVKVRGRLGRKLCGDVLAAVKHLTCLPVENHSPPCWLDGRAAPANLMVLANVILDPITRETYPLSPAFFATDALPVAYDPAAPAPVRWLAALDEWELDEEDRRTLQQFLGYLLVRGVPYHKALMLIGPKRSGKGTILRVMESLVGSANIATPKSGQLADTFALEHLLGKRMIALTDLNLDSRGGPKGALREFLLQTTGGDRQDVKRKNRLTLAGQMVDGKIVVATNIMPNWGGWADALPARFLTIAMPRSFYGSEDAGLDAKLSAELPGILNWALDGLADLRAEGRFTESKQSIEKREEMADTSNPLRVFVRENCVLGDGWTETDELFEVYVRWARERAGLGCGDDEAARQMGFRIHDKHVFSEKLRAAFPGLQDYRPRHETTLADGTVVVSRRRGLRGLSLRPGVSAEEPF